MVVEIRCLFSLVGCRAGDGAEVISRGHNAKGAAFSDGTLRINLGLLTNSRLSYFATTPLTLLIQEADAGTEA